MVGVCAQLLSHVLLFVIPWTVAHEAPLSRQESWSGLPCPPPGDLPEPGIKTVISCVSCLGRQILYHWATWKAQRLNINSSSLCFPLMLGIKVSITYDSSNLKNSTYNGCSIIAEWWHQNFSARLWMCRFEPRLPPCKPEFYTVITIIDTQKGLMIKWKSNRYLWLILK